MVLKIEARPGFIYLTNLDLVPFCDNTGEKSTAKVSKYVPRVRANYAAGDSGLITSSSPKSDTLVGHWMMDEGSGTTLLDASGYGNNALTSGNPTLVRGVTGQGLRFNGTSQFATATDNTSLDITGAITIAGWIRPEKTGTQYLIKKAVLNKADGYELSLSSSGTVFFRFNQESSGNSYRLDSKTTHPTDGYTWMHVAATYDGAVIRIYINGIENSTKALSSPPPITINGLALTIGAGDNGYRGFQGAMDDTRIYNTALKSSEILELAKLKNSVEIEKFQEKFLAYPNPFTTNTSISFTTSIEESYSISLFDGRGAKIKDIGKGIALSEALNTIEFDGSWMSTGIYLLKLEKANGESKIIRVLRR